MTMKRLKLLFCFITCGLLVGCNPPKMEIPKYPILTSIENTLWYSYNKYDNMYFDIMYEVETGSMTCYLDAERKEKVSVDNFTYTFTPAINQADAVVNVTFEDGRLYGGIVIPKGNVQVNYEHVYMIQLYEVDEEGNILYNANGEVKSSILMWKE